MTPRADRGAYEKELSRLQLRLKEVAAAYRLRKRRAYGEIDEFERMFFDRGMRIVKDERMTRFRDRFKHRKLCEGNLRNCSRWAKYATATEDMLRLTSIDTIPWNAISANDKRYARPAAISTDALPAGAATEHFSYNLTVAGGQ